MISGKVAVVEGDITQQPVDTIVNAANTYLLGGYALPICFLNKQAIAQVS